ncbi:MAG TPA: GAF domain-containing protein [Terriglobales bacterium]
MDKPVLDEGAFQQLLAAAYIVQQQLDQLRMARQAGAARANGKTASEDALAIIAETQERLRARAWDMDLAANLVAEGLQRITRAKGVAIALAREGLLHYVAATGTVSGLGGVSLPLPPDLSLASMGVDSSDDALVPVMRQPSGEQNELALPLVHDGQVVGILEVRFVAGAVPEAELRCCQLMAGLLTDVIARAAEARWKKALSPEHATMLEELNQVLPLLDGNLDEPRRSPADSEAHDAQPATPAGQEAEETSSQSRASRARRRTDRSQRKRGWQPVTPPQPASETPASPDTLALTLSRPHGVIHATDAEPTDALSTVASDQSAELLTPWVSSVRVRQWLDSLETGGSAHKWLERHRSDIYLGAAIVVLIVAIGLFMRTPTLPAQARSREPQLTLFEKILVALDLAEPPTSAAYAGNPDTMVWVDFRTALYYCPGADLYGKTDDGKFTTQRDAQIDQFQPAERKSCK